jgi:lysophospholipase L1-like esterase
VASMKATVDADLIARSSDEWASAVLFNLGANDLLAMPAEATWESNAEYILDAFHVKWPLAQVYLMRPWRRGYNSEADTLAGWIGTVVAARPTFAHLGPDERVFLKGADDGATYTSDGVHPNAAGYVLTAAQWQTVLGY